MKNENKKNSKKAIKIFIILVLLFAILFVLDEIFFSPKNNTQNINTDNTIKIGTIAYPHNLIVTSVTPAPYI